MVIVSLLFSYLFLSEPIKNCPFLMIMYLASNVMSSVTLGSKNKVPSTITVCNIPFVDSSTTKVYPLGIYTLSPFLGGASPPQASGSDHFRAPGKNSTLLDIKAYTPFK